MIIKDSNLTVMITDMDKSVAFYETLGLTVKQRWGNHYCMIGAPGLTLGLHTAHGPVTSSENMSMGFIVDDLTAATAILDNNGIAYQSSNDEAGEIAYFKDPDGHSVYYMKMKAEYDY